MERGAGLAGVLQSRRCLRHLRGYRGRPEQGQAAELCRLPAKAATSSAVQGKEWAV